MPKRHASSKRRREPGGASWCSPNTESARSPRSSSTGPCAKRASSRCGGGRARSSARPHRSLRGRRPSGGHIYVADSDPDRAGEKARRGSAGVDQVLDDAGKAETRARPSALRRTRCARRTGRVVRLSVLARRPRRTRLRPDGRDPSKAGPTIRWSCFSIRRSAIREWLSAGASLRRLGCTLMDVVPLDARLVKGSRAPRRTPRRGAPRDQLGGSSSRRRSGGGDGREAADPRSRVRDGAAAPRSAGDVTEVEYSVARSTSASYIVCVRQSCFDEHLYLASQKLVFR